MTHNRSKPLKRRRSAGHGHPCKGSALLIVMIGIIVLSLIGISTLDYCLTSRRLATRNSQLHEAQTVAESELEMMYYSWENLMRGGQNPSSVAQRLSRQSLADEIGPLDDLFGGTTPRTAFAASHRKAGWQVRRTFRYDTTLVGQLPDDPAKTGTVAYFTTGIIVTGSGPNEGITLSLGRRFVMFDVSLFQFAIFYQGDLELAPGSDMDVRGPVAANGSIYAGANQGKSLKFYDTVSFGQTFNGDTTGKEDKKMRNPKSFEPKDKSGNTKLLTAPKFSDDKDQIKARESKLKAMKQAEQENFIGGLDAVKVQQLNPDLFETVNDVYHSVIDPRPRAADPNDPDRPKDDPVIATRRMHNRAGLIITIDSLGTVKITSPSGTEDYASSAEFISAAPVTSIRKPVYDQREAKEVYVTTLDVGNLAKAIDNTPYLKNNFNGVLYVQDERPSNGVIRLTNAQQLPASADGFTVATPNALYIQGDYNTVKTDNQTTSAAVIADTITLLSSDWSDANAAGEIDKRKATKDTLIVAGILTGNTPTKEGGNSGGAHNLVRLMEDWSGRTITLKGSIGQLFTSKYFTSPFPLTLGTVYNPPANRVMVFDQTIANSPPPGSPTTVSFSRGVLITANHPNKTAGSKTTP